jgi:hypothetical protein
MEEGWVEGFVQIATELRGDTWWLVVRTGDGQESVKGPFQTEAMADQAASDDLPKILELMEKVGMRLKVN